MAACETPHQVAPTLLPGPTAREWIADNQGEVCYIAGRMHGQPEHGFPAFHRAEAKLWKEGVCPRSPAAGAPPLEVIERMERQYGDFRDSPLYAAMMRRDFAFVLQSRAIFMLPGWTDSRGACAEYDMAVIIRCPAFDGAWLLK